MAHLLILTFNLTVQNAAYQDRCKAKQEKEIISLSYDILQFPLIFFN